MYNLMYNKKENKAWAPLPEKDSKQSSGISRTPYTQNRQSAFFNKMKGTREKLYYETLSIPPENFNFTLTENGAVAYKSSGSALVDINFKITAMREMSAVEINSLFRKAYAEDPRLAIRWLGWLLDIRRGSGERRSSMIILEDMMNNGAAKIVANIIELIPEYGRWDMIYNFISNPITAQKVKSLIRKQFSEDIDSMRKGEPISLLAKWSASANSHCAETRKNGLWTAKALNLTERQYRKTLSELRKYIDVVERKMSSNNWQAIDYEKVPSKANLNYNKAFFKHDEERRRAYLDGLTQGKAKINASVVNPCEIVNKYFQSKKGFYYEYNPTLEGMWKALPNLIEPNKSMLVVADGSGSMTSRCSGNITCLDVANALAIYYADRAKGAFANKYITFSMTPQFVEFKTTDTLMDKIKKAEMHDECANTNLEAVFDLILQTAIDNQSPQSDLPESILLLSDMAFDKMVKANNTPIEDGSWYKTYPKVTKSFMTEINERFAAHGYQMPKIVYWNICGNGRTTTFPITQDDRGIMVSGYSANTLKMVMSGKTNPFEAIVEVVSNSRYLPFENALNTTY